MEEVCDRKNLVRAWKYPKPDGGVRKLGVPRVVDRLIQQALLQVLQKRWDRTFSEHSYGFRPGRSAHQAVPKRNDTLPRATTSWLTLISKNFSTGCVSSEGWHVQQGTNLPG